MISINEKQMKEYFREISKLVICPKNKKQQFINQLKNDIECFLAENPDATLSDIKQAFGSAEDIAESFVYESDSTEIRKKLSSKKLMLIAVIIALVIYGAFVIISLIDVHTEAHGYIEEGIMMIRNIITGGETV